MSEVQPDENVTKNNKTEDPQAARENGNTLGGSLSTSVSSLASSSGTSAKSGIPKPTGIKPAGHAVSQSPSRIGRICGNQHKPAVPTSPVKSSKFFHQNI